MDCGYQNVIVLDLSAVGMQSGTPTLELCRQLRSQLEHGTIMTGGGVSSLADLQAALKSGIDGVLVASALHDGQMTESDVRSVASSQPSEPSLADRR